MRLSPRMRWKLERYRRSFWDFLERLSWLLKASAIKQKVCPACRALVGASEARCPFCGEPLSALHRVGVRRMLAGLLPEHARYTTLLLGINFFLFGVSLLAAARSGIGLEALWSMPGRTLVALGARDYHVMGGEWWRLATAVFLHGNLIHLLFNALVLFDLGPTVEEMYGAARFLVLYFLAGIAGSLACVLWHPRLHIMIGASGALFGLIGVMIAYGYRHRTALGEQVRTMYVRWAIYLLVFGFVIPGIDNAAHIGGLLAGLAFGALVSDTPSFHRTSILAWRLASYAVLLTIAISFLLVAWNFSRLG